MDSEKLVRSPSIPCKQACGREAFASPCAVFPFTGATFVLVPSGCCKFRRSSQLSTSRTLTPPPPVLYPPCSLTVPAEVAWRTGRTGETGSF